MGVELPGFLPKTEPFDVPPFEAVVGRFSTRGPSNFVLDWLLRSRLSALGCSLALAAES